MFFSHIPELMIVLVVGLIVFGPKRLPEVGSALGQSIRDFKRGVSDLTEPARAALPIEDDEPRPVA